MEHPGHQSVSPLMQSQNEEAENPFSCVQCRSKKLKCDRAKPRCDRCARFGDSCEYPQSRRSNIGRRQRVHELEAKLDELERLARLAPDDSKISDQHTAGQTRTSPETSPLPSVLTISTSYVDLSEIETTPAELISTGTSERRPSPATVEYLTDCYFSKWHYIAPMLHRTRYLVSLNLPPHMSPPMCLQYIVMAWGAEMVNTHRHLAMIFYKRARAYAEADELKADNTLAHAQTWCLICYFEAQYLLFSQSSMSICRAIRIAQIAGLHRVDRDSPDNISLMSPPQSWLEAEERRRTWWALFCSDRLVGGTAGWPVLICEQDISTRLPASEAAFEAGIEEGTGALTSALQQGEPTFSPFAGRVLAASLFHQAFQHSTQTLPDHDSTDPRTSNYWKRHREIDNDLVILIQSLPDGLRLPKQIRCQNAIFVNTIIQTAVICLHRGAISKMASFGLPESMIRRSRARLACAAEEILGTFRMMSDINENLKNPILAHSLYMTSQVFLEDLSPTEEDYSRQDNLDLILRIITLSAKTMNNPVTGSLAVQLAMEMRLRGLDSAAVKQASELPLSRSLIPIFAQGDAQSSSLVFQLANSNETRDQAYP